MAAASVQDAIMLFGDSITQLGWQDGGFGQQLTHLYSRKLDVLNRGLSGYNTDWAVPVFEQILAPATSSGPKVRILVIWFGANDSCVVPSPQHVPLDRFEANLKHIIQLVTLPTSTFYSPSTKIVLVTPPPVDERQRKEDLESRNPPLGLDRFFENTKKYAEVVRAVAEDQKVGLVDVWSLIWEGCGQKEDGLGKYLCDGLHLTRLGYEVMGASLLEVIANKYPQEHYSKLQDVFCGWSDIDWSNPRPSLGRRVG